MEPSDFVSLHPRLYHMAADGSWSSIRELGLLTTIMLVEFCDVDPDLARSILNVRRSSTIQIAGPDGRRISIRDQKPLQLHNLRLDGTDLEGWLNLLNTQVFFWVDEEHLNRLLAARAYRGHPHHILTIDTAVLVKRHLPRIRLSGVNSGATIFPSSPTRGPRTFTSIEDYAWAQRRSRDGVRRPIVEATVVGGVPDLLEMVVSVHRVLGGVWTELDTPNQERSTS